MSFTVWPEGALADWQGAWTIFYWAWWIAFAPFVGLFLARVSRGRTIREYVLGAMFVPAIMGLTWFVLVGGTAIDLELAGNRALARTRHIIVWGGIYIAVVATLLTAGGMSAIRSAMIVGALPFSLVMALMAISLVKAMVFSGGKAK